MSIIVIIFMTDVIGTTSVEKKNKKKKTKNLCDIYFVSVANYDFEGWSSYFPDNDVNLLKLIYLPSWKHIFQESNFISKLEYAQRKLSNIIKKKPDIKIFPPPALVFNAFNVLPLNRIKVVIIGQDPYHNEVECKGIDIPEAMGLSFSVPYGLKIPSSLNNIFKNMLVNGRILMKPLHGNLITWACQGVLMLNASLTVQKNCQNSHTEYWQPFTDEIIKLVSSRLTNVVFVLWGAFALKKLSLIDTTRHEVIISSHPSGLSYDKPLKGAKITHAPFSKVDHFGLINRYLERNKKKPIIF
jgi:uracil-DNA glycosylase